MGRRHLVSAPFVVCGFAMACGGGEVDGNGPPECVMGIVRAESMAAPSVVVLSSAIEKLGVVGFETRFWQVTHNGAAVDFVARDTDSRAIEFFAEEPGVYQATLTGSVGDLGCEPASEPYNATLSTAPVDTFEIRVRGPNQRFTSETFEVARGADFSVGSVVLPVETELISVLTGGATPVPGRIRVWDLGAPTLVAESQTDVAGTFELATDGTYRVMVFPDELTQPAAVADVQNGSAVIPDARVVTGTVQVAGTPLSGAKVALTADGAPSTVGISQANGTYSLAVQPGSSVAITVVPPDGSGLPRLSGTLSGAVLGASTVDISFAAPSTVAMSLDITGPGSTNAKTRWVSAPIPGAGSATLNGSAQVLVGSSVYTVVADGGGALPVTTIVDSSYDLVIEPSGAQRPAIVQVDASSLPPTLAIPAAVPIDIIIAGDTPLVGAHVRVTPQGALGLAAGATQRSVSNESGVVAFDLAATDYDLVVEADASGAYPRTTVPIGPLTESISVPPSVALQGRVIGPATGERSYVQVYCISCSSGSATPIAEGLTDSDGSFALAIASSEF